MCKAAMDERERAKAGGGAPKLTPFQLLLISNFLELLALAVVLPAYPKVRRVEGRLGSCCNPTGTQLMSRKKG
jgi:hypothetical protein